MKLNKTKQLVATTLGVVLPLQSIFMQLRNRYILAYHRVLPAEIANRYKMQDSMWISVNTFNDDINWMKRHGDIVNLDTILDFETPNERPLFSITFDDGWIDNYEYAFPTLRRHNIPATIFLVTNAIETGQLFWIEDLLYKVAEKSEVMPVKTINAILQNYYLQTVGKRSSTTDTTRLTEIFVESVKPFSKDKREALLSDLYRDLNIGSAPMTDQLLNWSNIIEMSKYNIEFGSHTHTHEILQYADNELIAKELRLSKAIIAKNIGKPVKYFCYPNARYREDNADLIAEAGYTNAFRIHNLPINKHRNRYFVPRYLVNERVSRNKNYLLCRLLNIPKF